MSRKANFARLDELYDDNRKVKRAWRRSRAAVGLHAMAITYAKRHQTDGVIDVEWIEDMLPAARERNAAVAALVESGLFERIDRDRFVIHDFLDWQIGRAEREQRARKAQSAAHARWNADRMQNACDSHAGGDANRNAETETEEETEFSLSPTAVADEQIKPHPEAERLCHLLADLMRANDPGAKPSPASKGWRTDMCLLIDRDGRDPATVERIIRWCQTDPFWRSNILCPSKLRKQFPQLLLKSPTARTDTGHIRLRAPDPADGLGDAA